MGSFPLGRCSREFACRSPGSVSNPRLVRFRGAGDRKQSLGNAAAQRLVDRAAFERHWNRRSLVSAGVVKFTGIQDRDGNQASLATRR